MRPHYYTILSHIATWGVLFLLPTIFRPLEYPVTLIPTAAVIVLFYVNYIWLAPLHMKGHRALCWIINALLVSGIATVMYFTLGTGVGFVFNLAVAVIIAISMRMAKHWQQSEEARLKAEQAQVSAELSNLRYQTNPHFLLNTLNNIYALTAFDTRRAQEAIQQLSAMLRHILYDNQEKEVSIESEVDFLQNYIKLMKLRLPDNIDITSDMPQDSDNASIAPLLLIPLVENAFKHGVSTTRASFIHIHLKIDSQHIDFQIENSNHQKSDNDRSGHGIGLKQVQRRLDLAYPGRYTWNYGPDETRTVYHSHITITR